MDPHILFFPLPSLGDLTPMLKLAHLISHTSPNLHITFLNTTHNHHLLTKHTNLLTRFSHYPHFRFRTAPDGLPDDHPRAGRGWLFDLLDGLKLHAGPVVMDLLKGSNRVSCVVVDWTLRFVVDMADEVGVHVVKFNGTSGGFLWSYLCVPNMFEHGEIPSKDDEDLDKLVENIPGMTSVLRKRDLPDSIQSATPQIIEFIRSLQKGTHPVILNTFEDLEAPILTHIRTHFPKVYTIGPIQAHLKQTLGLQETLESNSISCSIWEEDRTCIPWLDRKPDNSVVFVSFGSLTYLTRERYLEIWVGLVRSKKYFLWVIRPDMIQGGGGGGEGEGGVSEEEVVGTRERGLMVRWAPQEEVLAHRAVGGFLTHSGWNSTLEGIVAGVPMICLPYFYDQMVNSRLVSEVWRVGFDMKGGCDRGVVEKMVNGVMDWRNDELKRSTMKMKYLAKKSVCEGGSSYCGLMNLIEDLMAMSKNAV